MHACLLRALRRPGALTPPLSRRERDSYRLRAGAEVQPLPVLFPQPDAEGIVAVLDSTPGAIARMEAQLPTGFPPKVEQPILRGLAASAKAPEAMPRE